MGQDKNLKSVGEECKNLNDRFNLFGEIHEEIQEHLTEDEKSKDCRIYADLFEETNAFRMAVYKWMFDTDQRIRDSKLERSSVKSRSSKSSGVSVVSSKARALEAKAKQAKLEARIAQLHRVETAKREEERVRLKAECVAAAAVSKVYEDAVKEDTEQYLGSDDPDNDDIPIDAGHGPSGLSVRVNDVTLNQPIVPAAEQSKGTLNPGAAEFVLPVTPLSRQVVDGGGGTSNHDIIECKDSTTESHSKPQVAFWEKLELRMSQPPPIPTPFDGDPAKYLRFRANFRDQVESKTSLTDSEKMNYLMSYTTGRAKKVIEDYQGLPNGCQLALLVLKERFGQNAMIVQALKSSVISGPKIRAGDSAAVPGSI